MLIKEKLGEKFYHQVYEMLIYDLESPDEGL